MIRLEKRAQPSQFWTFATPFLAVIMTMIVDGIMFAALGVLFLHLGLQHARSNSLRRIPSSNSFKPKQRPSRRLTCLLWRTKTRSYRRKSTLPSRRSNSKICSFSR